MKTTLHINESATAPLLYTELGDLCKIVGIPLFELARPLGFQKHALYSRINCVRNGKRPAIIPLCLVERLKETVGVELFAMAFRELRMPREIRRDVQETERITWGEAKKMLKICGLSQVEYAAAIMLSASAVNRRMGSESRRMVPLNNAHELMRIVGKQRYDEVIAIVRG
jgi:DNA-binding transcriptional regulator YiaG